MSPNPMKIGRIAGLGASALLGAAIAVLADVIQKEAASATLKIAAAAAEHLRIAAPPIVWAGILVLLGVGVCFVNEPRSRQSAFYAGASIVALLVTVVPYKPPPPPPSEESPKPARPTSLRPGDIVLAQVKPQEGGVPLDDALQNSMRTLGAIFRRSITVLVKADPNELPTSVLVTLTRVDLSGRRAWQDRISFKPDGSALMLVVRPEAVSRPPIRYFVTVEAEGFAIASASRAVNEDTFQVFEMPLKPSRAPLWLQRLLTAPPA
jgi:hypothetical protein